MRIIAILLLSLLSFTAFAGFWDYEINRFDQIDSSNNIPSNPILFVGSSTIRLWDTDHFFSKKLGVINRGFGGSQVKDILNHYDRLVLRYNPRAVVLYSGDNDLDFGKSVEEVFGDFKQLVTKIKRDLGVPIIWLLPKKAPSRDYLWDKIDYLNSLISQEYLFADKVRIVDLNTVLGLPSAIRFRYVSDGIHLNNDSYSIITKVVLKGI